MDLKLEVKVQPDKTPVINGKEMTVMLTPAIGEDYYIARVAVSKNQALVAFPKFFTIGIGFQKEKDWNTNLPYTGTAESIFDHIKHNKGSKSIPDGRCIEAIKMLQAYAASVKEQAVAA